MNTKSSGLFGKAVPENEPTQAVPTVPVKCQWCGCDLVGHGEVIAHKEWCDRVPSYIYATFQGLFRDVYNVIELSVDSDKAGKMKDLIGNRIMELRNKLTYDTADYLKSKLE